MRRLPFGHGLLAPSRSGQVNWLAVDSDPDKNGKPLAEPFQPRLEPGMTIDWKSPATIGDTQAVVSDGKLAIYLLGVESKPSPHLAPLAETAIAKPIAGAPALVGQTAYVADVTGALTALGLPKLAHGSEVSMGGRCVWGPAQVGDNLLVSTDDDHLLCFDAKGKQLWSVSLEHGALAGAPLRVDGQYLIASRNGIIWRADAATGKESGKVDVGYPLATGPVMCGQEVLVGGHDGTLYEVRQP